ncbi:MAG: hypothetical protein AAB923_00905 [Patescibacteria group bacterium]|mgnify:CR=1 FL=1
MPSLLPQLFFLSYAAMALVRLVMAFLFLVDARNLWRAGGVKKLFALKEIVIAFALGVGILTQAVALIAAAEVVYLMLREPDSLFNNKTSAFLAIVVLFLLLVNGPGPFAFDLPY